MMNKMKRFMALLTSVMMLMNMMPITALADTSGGFEVLSSVNVTVNYAYDVGNNAYSIFDSELLNLVPSEEQPNYVVTKRDYNKAADYLEYANKVAVKENGNDWWQYYTTQPNEGEVILDLVNLSRNGKNNIEVYFYYDAYVQIEYYADIPYTERTYPAGVHHEFIYGNKMVKPLSDGSVTPVEPITVKLSQLDQYNTSDRTGAPNGVYSTNPIDDQTYKNIGDSAFSLLTDKKLVRPGATIAQTYAIIEDSSNAFELVFRQFYMNEYNVPSTDPDNWEHLRDITPIYGYYGEKITVTFPKTDYNGYATGDSSLSTIGYYVDSPFTLWKYNPSIKDMAKEKTSAIEASSAYRDKSVAWEYVINGKDIHITYPLLYRYDKPVLFSVTYYIDDVRYGDVEYYNGSNNQNERDTVKVRKLPNNVINDVWAVQCIDVVTDQYTMNSQVYGDLTGIVKTAGDQEFLMVDRDIEYRAYTPINVDYVAEEGGSVTNSQDVVSRKSGEPINGSTAVPSQGYNFIGWYKDGTLISEEPELTKALARQRLNSDGKLYEYTKYVAKFAPKPAGDEISVPAQIAAKKVLNGRTLANEQFIFQLKDAQGNVIDTQKNDADGNVTFDLSFDVPDTYTYTISEVNDEQAGYTYSAAVYNVTVTVSQDASTKQLSAAVSYTNLSAGTTVPTFENTYTAQPAELSIPVVKNYVHAANLNAPDITNKFQFTITGEVQGDAAAVAPLPSNTTITNSGANFSFDAIEFTAPGTYVYTITESGTVAGVTNDSAKTVTIVVVDNGAGKLVINEAASDYKSVKFVNEYAVTAVEVSFPIQKTIEVGTGLTAPDAKGMFSFTLTPVDGAPQPAVLSQTNPDANGGVMDFGPITFSAPGTYEYTISEAVEAGKDASGFTLADAQTVTIQVEDNGQGQLTYTASSTKDNILTFTNTYSVEPIKATIKVEKEVTGEGAPDIKNAFTFTLSAAKDVPMPASTEKTNPDVDGGVITFGEIEFDQPGTYTYTVTESGAVTGIVNDSQSAKTVQIQVVDNGNGTMTATVSPETVKFTNKYSVIDLSGTKVWEDQDNKYDTRPASIIVNAKNGDEVVKSVTVTPVGDDWSWTIEDLPQYDAAGKEISYTITEDAVAGYDTEVDGTEITNTLKTIDLSGTKVWDDQDNKYDTRPASITVNAKNGDEVVKSVTVTPVGDDWSWTIEDLPQYDAAGKEISYAITEDAVVGYDTEVDGTEITNTLKTIDLSGTKVWDDQDNKYDTRPASITVNAKNGDEVVKSVTVTPVGDDWSWTIEDLPQYDAAGKEISYTITEDAVVGYDTEVDGTEITNTLKTIDLSGTKVWVDQDNKYNTRPESITVNAKNGDKVVKSVTVTPVGEDWSWTIEDLPQYDAAGKEISYTITEDAVAGYDTEVDGNEITNTLKTIDLSGTKVWDDQDNKYDTRPATITINAKNGDEVVKSVTVTPVGDDWSWTIEDLPQYDAAGKEISYTITEDAVAGYDSEVDGTEITNTLKTKDVTVTKKWEDNSDQDGKRPDTIELLLKNGNEVVGRQTINAKNGDEQSYTFADVPATANGVAITYTVDETSVTEGYTKSVAGLTITNTHEPEKTSLSGTKVWDDANDQDGKRPDSITINLMKQVGEDDAVSAGESITLSESSGWNWEFTGLARYEAGKMVTYSVTEEQVAGYTTNIAADENGYVTITNSYTPEITSVSGAKTWDDLDNIDRFRPTEVVINLLADGTKIDSQTVRANGEDQWLYSFTNLPKYRDQGTEIKYTVTEDAIAKYFPTITATNDGFDIVNKAVLPKLQVEKTSDKQGQTVKLGETINYTITVTNTGNVTVYHVFVEDKLTDENWTIDELAIGATATFKTSYEVTSDDILAGTVLNHVTAKGDPVDDPSDPENPKVPEGEDEVEDDPEPIDTTLVVEKTSDKQGQTVKLGETITYTIKVTNDGNVPFENVKVVDELTGDAWTIATLAVGATETFTATHVVTSDDILAGTVLNSVTAKADPIPDPDDPENPKVPEGEDEVEDDPEPIDTTLVVEKTSDKQGQTVALGETITYTITVTNGGNVPFKNVKVVDELTGDAWTIETLAVGVTETFTATHVVTSDDILAGTVLNHVTAKGDPIPDPADPENPKVPEGEDEVEDDPEPIDTTLVVEKTSDVATTAQVGDTITYTITVSNMGNVPYTNVKVDDELTGMHETISVLAVGESQTLTTTRVVTMADAAAGSILNVAVATADPIPDPDDPTTPKVPEGTDTEEDDVDPIPPVEPAKYRVTVRYWYEYVDGETAAKTFKQQYATGDAFHVTSPIIPGYTVDIAAVTGVMEAEDLVFDVIYMPVEYKLTIEYIYTDGTPVAPDYTEPLSVGDAYDVDSPELRGYDPSATKVEGTMPARDVKVTVVYVKMEPGYILIGDYNTPLGLGNVNLNAGECFE